jgi:Flp pilus assembly protein TadD
MKTDLLFRVTVLVCVLTTAACTTTVTQHATDIRPLEPRGTPSTASELRIAETALESGNLDMATTIYSRIVKADENSVPGLTGLGNTLYAVGDFTRAGVYFQKASQIEPDNTAPLIGMARVAMHQRRLADAAATYHRVLALKPNDALASAGLGAALDLAGDHAGAQDVLRAALKANPGDPMLAVNLGLSLVLSGHPREGANVLLDVTRFPSAPPQAREDLALAYGLLGNTEAAAELLGQDLPKASVDDNLRYYALQRARLMGASAPSSMSAPMSAPTATKVGTGKESAVSALPAAVTQAANGPLAQ